MIIVAIIALSMVVLSALLIVFGNGLPAIPQSVMDLVGTATGYIQSGAGLFWAFVYPAPVKAMLALTLGAIVVYETYGIIMWIVKKIPMFGVSD